MRCVLIAGAAAAALLAGVPAFAQSSTGGTGSGLRANSSSVVGLGSTEWGGWGYGGYGGLGGYNPYYQSYYTYQVTDQYWEIQMVDLKNSPPAGTGGSQQQLNVIYDATIRGTDITDTQAVDSAVTAIFNQSPYLQATR